jgi:hypothetical protein
VIVTKTGTIHTFMPAVAADSLVDGKVGGDGVDYIAGYASGDILPGTTAAGWVSRYRSPHGDEVRITWVAPGPVGRGIPTWPNVGRSHSRVGPAEAVDDRGRRGRYPVGDPIGRAN